MVIGNCAMYHTHAADVIYAFYVGLCVVVIHQLIPLFSPLPPRINTSLCPHLYHSPLPLLHTMLLNPYSNSAYNYDCLQLLGPYTCHPSPSGPHVLCPVYHCWRPTINSTLDGIIGFATGLPALSSSVIGFIYFIKMFCNEIFICYWQE